MSSTLKCLVDQLGETEVNDLLKSAGWDEKRIAAASDIDVERAIRGELNTREVALHRSKLNAIMLAELQQELTEVLDAVPTVDSKGNPITADKLEKQKAKIKARWLAGLVTPDTRRGGLNAKPSIDQLRGGYLNRAFAALSDLTEAIAPNTYLPAFLRDKSLRQTNRDIAKYLHGDKTAVDPELAKMLDAWLEVANGLRERANQLGADIPKLEGWGLRHSWSADKVSKVSREEFINDLVDSGVLDAQRMAGEGAPPMSEEQLRVAVGEVYESIVTGGQSKRKPSMVDLPGIIAKRHGEERQLHFKDGAAWFDTAKKYSEGLEDDLVLRSMYHYIEDLAGDIAIMERLGPSAAQNLRYMADVVMQATSGQEQASVLRTLNTFKSIARQDRSLHGWLASAGAALRSYQVTTKLGSAFLSAASDFGFTATTAKQYGASMGRIMADYSKLMAGMSPKEMQAMGLTADFLSRTINRTTRYGDRFGAGVMGRLADLTMKVSLLERHTLFGQLAFQMEINRVLGSHVGKTIDQLPDKWPDFFKHYALTEDDWLALQGTLTKDGMLDPTALPDAAQSARILGAFQQEVRYAFFEPNVRERTLLTGGSEAGTFKGELLRAVTMFKSFPIGIMVLHWGRIAGMNGPKDKLAYAATMVATTTMLGALSLMAKEMAKGRTPPDPTTPEFMFHAFIQGGSGGLLTDIVGREHRSGEQLIADLAGPVLGDLASAKVTLQKVVTALNEDGAGQAGKRLASDTLRAVEGSIPLANVWYMRALITNKAFDAINREFDPMYWEKRNGLEGWLQQRGQSLNY